MPRSGNGVLGQVENAFKLLVSGPQPLALHGGELGGGLPNRWIPLDVLRDHLTGPGTGRGLWDPVWRELVVRARREPAWRVAAVAMALPRLRRVVWRLTCDLSRGTEDVIAEVLTGFLDRLSTVDPDSGRLCGRLCWAGYKAGFTARYRDAVHARHRSDSWPSTSPPMPFSHPDLVIWAAVADGAILAEDAELIGRTRLENTAVTDLAAELDEPADLLFKRRRRAETRLLAWVSDQAKQGWPAWLSRFLNDHLSNPAP